MIIAQQNTSVVDTVSSFGEEGPSFSTTKSVGELGEVWRYRNLLYFLCWRDLKVRYKQTVLGASWALAQPLFTMVIFTIVFGKIAKIPSNGIPYPLFSLAALIPWGYFSGAVGRGSLSVVNNGHLIGKIYFPRILIPVSSIIPAAIDFALSLVFLFGYMIYRGFIPSFLFVLALPFLFLWLASIALGISLWLSALHVRVRDIGHALPFLLQLWMYVTPVIFPISYVPERFHWLLFLNPLTGVIEAFRNSLFALPWNHAAGWISVAETILLVTSGYFFFRKRSQTFADIV